MMFLLLTRTGNNIKNAYICDFSNDRHLWLLHPLTLRYSQRPARARAGARYSTLVIFRKQPQTFATCS